MKQLFLGDCLIKLKELDDNSVDSIVTDPPYGLAFMGKKWDYDVPSKEIWMECLRVLKPGGFLLSFGGSRTYHRMAVAIEDAGFEIRDQIMWLYGSGFPKSHNISKAIDKTLGAEREVVGVVDPRSKFDKSNRTPKKQSIGHSGYGSIMDKGLTDITKPTTQEAKQWDGWGTALKPAHEPIVVARKPLSEKTVASNVLKWGTGGINIDASRISTNPDVDDARLGGNGAWKPDKTAKNVYEGGYAGKEIGSSVNGRFPANVIHDGSDEVVSGFPYGKNTRNMSYKRSNGNFIDNIPDQLEKSWFVTEEGSAARFFYCPKTSKKDRSEGLDDFTEVEEGHNLGSNSCGNCGMAVQSNGSGKKCECGDARITTRRKRKNTHPTVKPTDLMKYLVRMVTPRGGTTLDPFMGSGSTGKGAVQAGFNFIGIEMDDGYFEIAKARIQYEIDNPIVDETGTRTTIERKGAISTFFDV